MLEYLQTGYKFRVFILLESLLEGNQNQITKTQIKSKKNKLKQQFKTKKQKKAFAKKESEVEK